MGDSWTGWTTLNECNQYHIAPINNYLKDLGHTISIDISQPGASNFGQLRMLTHQVDFSTIDYIIWLYTEPARSLTEFYNTEDFLEQYPDLSYTKFYQDLNYVQHRDFVYAQGLFAQHHKPFAVIGGAGQINKHDIKYPFIDFLKPSWNKEISNLENMPINCYTHHVETLMIVDKFNYDKSEIMNELDNLEKLTYFMHNNEELYYDKYHPSPHLYKSWLESMLTSKPNFI
jgi:hypothetical protein